jgi:hypothetical protein
MIRWLIAGIVLAASPALAAETVVDWGLTNGAEPRPLCVYDTSHTCVPIGKLDSNTHAFSSLANSLTVCNVTAYGADPTGVADSSTAFNTCAAKTMNGQPSNIYVPAGTYLLKNKVTVSAQCLFGDGKTNTFLKVDQTFNSAATSVIYLTGIGDTGGGDQGRGGCVHDLAIQFDQPGDQAVRANFKTLAAGCTSSLGGSGCKYPPAIYNDGVPGRVRLYNLRIERSWDSINLQRASGLMIDSIEEGALNVGLRLDNGSDFGYVSHWEHWPFGESGGTGALVTGVWMDGLNFAAVIGNSSGNVMEDFRTFEGRIQLTSAFSWGTFISPEMDNFNATFEVAHVQPGSPGLSIIGGYTDAQSKTTTAANNTHCALDFTATTSDQKISVVGMTINSGAGSTTPQLGGICIGGFGETVITGGHITSSRSDLPAIYQNGGHLVVTGVDFGPGGGQPRTAPVVNVNNGTIMFTDNMFNTVAGAGNVDGILVRVDGVGHMITGNHLNGWDFTPPGPLGIYGPNGPKCTISGASPQACNSWLGTVTTGPLSTAALTSASYVVNNSTVAAGSLIRCGIQNYAGAGVALITQCVSGAGTITVNIYNASSSAALSGTLTFGFSVQ